MTREEKEQACKYVLELANSLEKGCYRRAILLRAAHIIDESLDQEEPFMNKPCVAHQVCHENKIKVLDKIWNEIKMMDTYEYNCQYTGAQIKKMSLDIIDKYITESEEEE